MDKDTKIRLCILADAISTMGEQQVQILKAFNDFSTALTQIAKTQTLITTAIEGLYEKEKQRQ